jgi:hypothetical protein
MMPPDFRKVTSLECKACGELLMMAAPRRTDDDALRSDAELDAEQGHHLNPAVVRAFLRVHAKHESLRWRAVVGDEIHEYGGFREKLTDPLDIARHKTVERGPGVVCIGYVRRNPPNLVHLGTYRAHRRLDRERPGRK